MRPLAPAAALLWLSLLSGCSLYFDFTSVDRDAEAAPDGDADLDADADADVEDADVEDADVEDDADIEDADVEDDAESSGCDFTHEPPVTLAGTSGDDRNLDAADVDNDGFVELLVVSQLVDGGAAGGGALLFHNIEGDGGDRRLDSPVLLPLEDAELRLGEARLANADGDPALEVVEFLTIEDGTAGELRIIDDPLGDLPTSDSLDAPMGLRRGVAFEADGDIYTELAATAFADGDGAVLFWPRANLADESYFMIDFPDERPDRVLALPLDIETSTREVLIVSFPDQQELRIMEPDGELLRVGDSAVLECRPVHLAGSDLDGDLQPEVVVSCADGSLEVITTGPAPGLGSRRWRQTERSQGAVAAGDLDGDGDDDLIAAGAAGVALYCSEPPELSFRLQIVSSSTTGAALVTILDLDSEATGVTIVESRRGVALSPVGR